MGESDENSRGLDLVESIQGETKERLVNIQRTLGETTTVAEQTEAALAEQMHQIQSTDEELTRLHSVMETSKKLLNKFDRWAFHKTNMRETKAEAERMLRDGGSIPLEEQFMHENQCYRRKMWIEARDPSSFVFLNGKPALDIRSSPESKWKIDYTFERIDQEGWTYASDFKALKRGKTYSKPKWNSYVRRRQWRLERCKSTINELAHDIKKRAPMSRQASDVRVCFAEPSMQRSISVPIMDTGSITDSEHTRLEQIHSNNNEIDGHISVIAELVGGLESRARSMNEQVRTQNLVIEQIEAKMDNTAAKLVENSARTVRSVRRR